MKNNLEYKQKNSGPCCVGGSEDKAKTMYPCVRIPITEANKELLESIPGKGKATFHFRTKKIEIGPSDYGAVENEAGCIELEIHAIDLNKSGASMLNMSASDSLDSYMKDRKEKDEVTETNEEDED